MGADWSLSVFEVYLKSASDSLSKIGNEMIGPVLLSEVRTKPVRVFILE